VRKWLGREYADPDLAAALHLAHDRPARGFDLTGRNPAWFERLQTEITEGNLGSAQRFSAHTTTHLLAPLYTFWH
jgi:hypothetical protein